MRETHISLPELALIAGTRAALGAGLGLLLSERLPTEQRKAVGWSLLLFGALTTVPLAFEVLGGSRQTDSERTPERSHRLEAKDRLGQRAVPSHN